ncbi:MAG: MFS transporter, partial [Candidatus Bathyarchaeota archaeon]
RINIAASIGSIGATLISGYVMTAVGGSLANMYMIPIVLATLCVFFSSTAMLKVREKKFSNDSKSTPLINWELFRSNVNFRTLCQVSFVHSFFMSISWPLFAITMVRVIKIDMIQIAYISIISSIVAIFVRRLIGRITDYAGRRRLIIISRAGIFIYPTIYAFATNFYHLVIANLIVGVFGAISEIVIFAYQLDVTSEGQRGASLSLYNTVSGVATFFGSLFGGYIPSVMMSLGLNELVSIQLAYAISAIGRLGGGLLFLKIKEPISYPSTIRKEIKRVVSEDIERTKEELEQIELKGERVDYELHEDFELLEGRIRKKEY